MTATTDDGNEIFADSKLYMPVPLQFARGSAMGRGPYEKSGLILDTGLPAGRKVMERFHIPVPDRGDDASGAAANPGRRDVKVSVKLLYLPFGDRDVSPFLWREVVRTVSFGDDE